MTDRLLLLAILAVVVWIAIRQEGIRMATKQDFDTLRADFDAETNRLAAKVQELIDKLGQPGLSAAEEAQVLKEFGDVRDRLKIIGSDPTNPIPPA